MYKRTILVLVGIVQQVMLAQQATLKPVTVNQLNQLLAADRGMRDEKLAKQFAGLELTERASSAALSRLEQQLADSHAREALIALADKSAFLELPAAEIPTIATPDISAHKS